MKQITLAFRAALLMAVMASLVSCGGGIFIDPGHLDAGVIVGGPGFGDDDNSASKPDKLSISATAQEAIVKLDEIIAYCDASGSKNSTQKSAAELLKSSSSGWNVSWFISKAVAIQSINDIIDGLL